jgi:hypothetical protein
LVDACLREANGHAEPVAALHLIEPRAVRPDAITLGADKACDTQDFVNELRSMGRLRERAKSYDKVAALANSAIARVAD